MQKYEVPGGIGWQKSPTGHLNCRSQVYHDRSGRAIMPGKVHTEPLTLTGPDGETLQGWTLRGHDGRRVYSAGTLWQDGLFTRSMPAKYLLRKPPAICLQAEIVNELERRGCRQLRITVVGDEGQRERYCTDFTTILRDGFTFDRGFGEQIGVPLSCWRKMDAGGKGVAA